MHATLEIDVPPKLRREQLDEPVEDELAAPLFAVLWAAAHLFHVVSSLYLPSYLAAGGAAGIAELLLAVSAIAVILWPTKGTLALLAAVQIVGTCIAAPFLPNHRLLAALVNATFLAVLVPSIPESIRGTLSMKGRPPRRTLRSWFADAAPLVRTEVLIFYGFTGFHKLNTGFLDPASSCAGVFLGNIREVLPIIPPGLATLRALPFTVVAVELLLPVFLLFGRTRRAALLAGLLFHFGLAFDPQKHFFDFSSTMTALLMLFMPRADLARWRERSLEGGCALQLGHRVMPRLVFLAAILWVLQLQLRLVIPAFYVSRQMVWWGFGLGTIAAFVWSASERWLAPEPLRIGVTRTFGAIPVLLVVLNGVMPYLGLKTRSSFDMYSNLRVEGGRSNHLLVRSPVSTAGLTDDLVRIIDSDRAELQSYAGTDLLLPFFELHRLASPLPDSTLTFERHGRRETVLIKENGELATPLPLLLRKLLWFRPVDALETSRCQW